MSVLPDIDYNYVPDKPVICQICKWKGILKNCRQERYISSFEAWQQLAGRDGWIYHCPECDSNVAEHWDSMN